MEFLYGIAVIDPTTATKGQVSVIHFVGYEHEPTMYDYIMVYRELTTIDSLNFNKDKPFLLVPASSEVLDAVEKSIKNDEMDVQVFEDYSEVEGNLQ
jgi:hypothetical protein